MLNYKLDLVFGSLLIIAHLERAKRKEEQDYNYPGISDQYQS